ncbi:MAG: type II toxin-antitoxin system PemK/MazF family toxin [Bacilli bacterium]|nr:type II toxin-antitoxin system PemK/MazF family toxin [Bacilli bacterium]
MASIFLKKYENGSIYHINFGRTFHPELKSKHLGVLFNIKSSNNMILCLPMTSPKKKHFKTVDAFNNRDIYNLKYPHLYYIKETDSMVLLEQFRTISKARIESQYKNPSSNQKVILSINEQEKLKKSFKKFVSNILK